MQFLLRIIPTLLILALGYYGWQHYYLEEEPEQTKKRPQFQEKRAIKSQVIDLIPTDYQINIYTQGIVRTSTSTPLNAQVSGRILEINPNFQNGSFFKQGDILLVIDSSDYESQVISAEATLARSEAALAQEKARGEQARRNWEDIGFQTEPNELVLRIPQLKEAEASLKSAQAGLQRALRNLERTKVRAPYDGRVRERLVGPGQVISSNARLGEIYSTEKAEVRLPLSNRQLAQLDLTLDENGTLDIPVTFRDSIVGSQHEWHGTIVRSEGELDVASRELFVIAEIEDPFGLNTPKSPLRFNQPVDAQISGNTLDDVLVIPRLAVRGADTIYAVVKNKLRKTPVTTLWSATEEIIIRDESLHHQQLAISRLGFVADGAKVIIVDPTESTPTKSHAGPKARAVKSVKR